MKFFNCLIRKTAPAPAQIDDSAERIAAMEQVERELVLSGAATQKLAELNDAIRNTTYAVVCNADIDKALAQLAKVKADLKAIHTDLVTEIESR